MSLNKSLGRYMESQGKEYRKPEYFEKNAKTVALRKMGMRKLKVKSEK